MVPSLRKFWSRRRLVRSPAGWALPGPFGLLRRLRAVFAYYATHHLEIVQGPWRLETAEGAMVGYLEELRLAHGRVHLRGWCLLSPVRLRLGAHSMTRHPTIERNDVADALGCDPLAGFEASLPAGEGPLIVAAGEGGPDAMRMELPMPGPVQIARARARLRWRFLRDLLRLSPMILLGLLRRDPTLRSRVKSGLGLDRQPGTGLLMPRALANHPAAPRVPVPEAAGLSVVLPLYNAFELLDELFDRLERHTDLPWRLVAIEDCSSDARVRPFVRRRCEALRSTGIDVTLIEAETNRGFVASVNDGLARAAAHGDPVVVLNSDALVPAGWASRLLRPLMADHSVASVTPMSNDAEIYTVPVLCEPLALAPGQGDAIDAVARDMLAPEAGMVEAPTGVGFCLALAPRFLAALPAFDTAFGRGYGEEVDWCRRATALGGRHVAAANLFVEHRGGQSFGAREKRARIRESGTLISRRYPDYDALVQEFIQRDPLLTPRLTLALALLASLPGSPEVPVYIAHSMGGGAENWLEDRIARAEPQAAVILRMGGPHRVRIEVVSAAGRTSGATDNLALVERLLALLPWRRIVYSCAVGDPDPAAIPAWLRALSEEAPLDVLFHDYLPVSPSYTLLDGDGVYRAPPVATPPAAPPSAAEAPASAPPAPPVTATPDTAHRIRRPDGSVCELATWQADWGRTLEGAARVVTFSASSRDIVERVYPALKGRVSVQPHALIHRPPAVPGPEGKPPVIGVLGNIGPQKGAGVLQALSRQLGPAGAGLVLLGRIAPGFVLSAPARLHGGYELADLPELVSRYGITCWLIPSIWPETFSYTTHECLATGLPVMAFNIGAQGEAVAAAETGFPIPLPRRKVAAARLAANVLTTLDQVRARGGAPHAAAALAPPPGSAPNA